MGETPEVLGPYVIYERLGAGGMATVHRAEHVGVADFRRPVALKRLLPQVADDPAMLEMFSHEARLASHLHHANVAATYDLGKVDDTYFIAMEYVPGPTLTQIMKQCGTVIGPMPVPIVLVILQQLLDALDHAHNLTDDMGVALGIVHRDISPSNIIVSTSGIVKLIDFGIAKAAIGGVHTQTGMIKGKYAYIAPEYMLGQLDSRADLFGVGIIAHELLSTKRLFNATSDYETLQRLRAMPIVEPSRVNKDVPPDLDDIVLTALQRDPDQRWQSASAMRTAITNVARSMKGGMITNQQLTEWVEWAFSRGDGEDDLTRARHVERASTASDAADPTIPPPAPASRARTRLGRVTADPPMDPYETMTAAPTLPVKKRTANLAAVSRSAQLAAQRPGADTAPFDDSGDTSDQASDASGDLTINRVLQPAKIGGLASPVSRKRRLDASEYEIEVERRSTTELSPRDRLSMQLTVDEEAETPVPVRTSAPRADRSLDQALGSLDATLLREREVKPRPGGATSRSVGGAPSSALGSGGLPPQRDSPMPLGSPPTPPPRNAGNPSSRPFGGPPPMPPASTPLPPQDQTIVINPSAGAVSPARIASPSHPPTSFPPAHSAPNAFAPVAPTLMVAPVLSPASVINPSAPVINPSAPFAPPRPAPSQPPPFIANRLVVPTVMPLGGPSSLVAERAALIPSLPRRAVPPLVVSRPSHAKTIVATVNDPAPSAANASTVIADMSSIRPVMPPNADAVPPLVPARTAPLLDERAKRPSQHPEQNFARALVLPDAPPPVAAFPAGEDSGEMLVAPGENSLEQPVEAENKRDKNPVLPAAPDGPRRWPWILLLIVLLGVGAGAYVYFFGFGLP